MDKYVRIQWLKQCTEKERQDYYAEVASQDCVACGAKNTLDGENRTSLHHCNDYTFPKKREHRPVIPLCLHNCHLHGPLSVHQAKTTFTLKYGDQTELLEKVEAKL